MRNPNLKLYKIRLDLEEYDFEVEYLRENNNYVVDALSRITIDDLNDMGITIDDEKQES